jgi:hypothetical protein
MAEKLIADLVNVATLRSGHLQVSPALRSPNCCRGAGAAEGANILMSPRQAQLSEVQRTYFTRASRTVYFACSRALAK